MIICFYLASVAIAFLLTKYYFEKVGLNIDESTIFMIVMPILNIGTIFGSIYCILTKRHYNSK